MTTDEAVSQVSAFIGKNFDTDVVPTQAPVNQAISNILDVNGIPWVWLTPEDTLGDSNPARVIINVDEKHNITSVTTG